MGLDKNNLYDMRLLSALERIALAQERVANHLDKQEELSSKFRDFVEAAVEPPGSESAPTEVVRVDSMVEAPRIVDWYIDTKTEGRPIVVRLSDGTSRHPTPEEASKLG